MYVSGYYHIPKRSMPHMGISRYLRLGPVSLKMIADSKLVFFYEEDCIREIVQKISDDWSIDLVPIHLPISRLPQRQAALTISANATRSALPPESECRKEKGWSHLNGMVHGDDRTEYEDNLTVWLSKIDLVNKAAKQFPSSNQLIAWMDFGIAKFNYIRDGWSFPDRMANFSRSKLSHYNSLMRMHQSKLPLNASFLIARSNVWEEVQDEFHQQIASSRDEDYPHDEETLLSRVVQTRPELFDCIGDPYHGRIGKVRYLLERFRARSF